MLRGRKVMVLSGAGLSTESGIPDYRGPSSKKRTRGPIRYQEFIGSAETRQRYWARSAIGWSRITEAEPNAGHSAIAQLELQGRAVGVVTQNVDGLHQAAGSRRVVELHGGLDRAVCLNCGALEARITLQQRMESLNPSWLEIGARALPDGDAQLPEDVTRNFVVPPCLECGGVLKPDVVFFGENVPKDRVAAAFAMLSESDVLFVVGSSLTVFSGYRFVRQAATDGRSVAIANIGPTRGDDLASVRVEARLGEILPELVRRLIP
jgi:NAD-dependent SIR2 family protein deacetylase